MGQSKQTTECGNGPTGQWFLDLYQANGRSSDIKKVVENDSQKKKKKKMVVENECEPKLGYKMISINDCQIKK